MSSSEVITVRIDKALKDRLDRLADATDRSRSHHAIAAIEEYVAREAWQIEAIREGVAAADRGDLVAHEDVGKWIASLGGKRRKARPSSGR